MLNIIGNISLTTNLPIFKSLLARIFSTPDLEKGPPHPYMGVENARAGSTQGWFDPALLSLLFSFSSLLSFTKQSYLSLTYMDNVTP